MNGKQKLYESIVTPSIPDRSGSEQAKRNSYSEERDEAMVYRFYFHAELERRRYDDCLVALRTLFYLTEEYIVKVLGKDKNHRLLKSLVNELKPSPDQLRKRYPFYNWTVLRG